MEHILKSTIISPNISVMNVSNSRNMLFKRRCPQKYHLQFFLLSAKEEKDVTFQGTEVQYPGTKAS